ncbi:plasmid pRiA4b ORF-3 family protein [Agromyces italicus]|uniref:plasmid pRiA4b ORF-3 family protein n=1 Tax=Agromyces italicus TaxID=279572 RepID=UPI0003B708E3|nr:plasmid pRiA4b ORF-3 family protein [Agromyces italicus]
MTATERFRLRISLVESEPEIWRTLDVDGRLTLDELHDAIQIAFGWHDVHLHEFGEREPWPTARRLPTIGRPQRRWLPAEQLDEAAHGAEHLDHHEELLDESAADVASVFDLMNAPLYYWYDFGDDWWHRIDLIERERSDAPDASQPPWRRRVELVRGERRGPLEDSGGVHGYAELCERLADESAPGHRDALEWVRETAWPGDPGIDAGTDRYGLGDGFDPEAFDHGAVDRALAARFEEGAAAGDARPVSPDVPLATLLQRMPPAYRAPVLRRLRTAGALDVVAPQMLEAEIEQEAARMVRPFLWLGERIGDRGLALTQAGWMPPAAVTEGMTELGWIEDWVGKANREDITTPIRELRAAARRFGLVRVAKGRLLRTALGTRLQRDPVALWRHLVGAVVDRAGSASAHDAVLLAAIEVACGTPGNLSAYGRAVATGLDALGWGLRNGLPLDSRDGIELVRDTWRLFGALGCFDDDPARPRIGGNGAPNRGGRLFAEAVLGVRAEQVAAC